MAESLFLFFFLISPVFLHHLGAFAQIGGTVVHVWFVVLLNDGGKSAKIIIINNVKALPFHSSLQALRLLPLPPPPALWEGCPGECPIILKGGDRCHEAKPDVF